MKFSRSAWKLSLLPVCLFFCTVLAAPPALAEPNILFFLADDLGWGDAPSYNPDSRIPMPHFDKLADQGMRFTDAHSPAAICAPTRYSAITGNYQWRGLYPQGQWDYKGGSQVLANQWSVADMLKARGYATAMFGKLHMGGDFYEKGSDNFVVAGRGDAVVDFSRGLQNGPLTYGFDYAYTLLRGIQGSPYAYFENDRLVGDPLDLMLWRSGTYGDSAVLYNGIGMPYWNTSEIGPDLVRQAVGFIDRHHLGNLENGTDTPFFIYYASQSAHQPWTPPEYLDGDPVGGVTGMTPHTDMVHEIDAALGALIRALEERGLAENTLIVFTSDNGGIPNEVAYGHDAVGGLRGQKKEIWEGGHRVPLVVKWGDGTPEGSNIPPGTVSSQLVGVQDIASTLAALAGLALPANQARDSFNFLPVLTGDRGDDDPVRDHMIMQSFTWVTDVWEPAHYAFREGAWKLVLDADGNALGLYDLENDLQETDNRLSDPATAALAAGMKSRFQTLRQAPRTAPMDDIPVVETDCGDGLDSDGDGLSDCDDPDCAGLSDCIPSAETICTDGLDNDGDGLSDCDDPDCAGLSICAPEAETICADGLDNDGDGLSDCDDPDCSGSADCPSTAVLSAEFASGSEGFVYADDLFNATRQPAYASGGYGPSAGVSGAGGLHLRLGGVDRKVVADGMSGGWTRSFSLGSASGVRITLSYRVITTGYDANECVEPMAAIDGISLGEMGKYCGRGEDTGWRRITFSRDLGAGTHTLAVGGYGNKKTAPLEYGDIYFDNVSVSAHSGASVESLCNNALDDDGDGLADCDDPDCAGLSICAPEAETICADGLDNDGDGLSDCDDPDCSGSADCPSTAVLSAEFASGLEGFVYADDLFNATRQPAYASGGYGPSAGVSGAGGLHLRLGGVDRKVVADGMSGGWTRSFSLGSASGVRITLSYRVITTGYDANECVEPMAAIDGISLGEMGKYCGRGEDTGWRRITFSRDLGAGTHTLAIGGYGNKKTAPLEYGDIYFDNVSVSAHSGASVESLCNNALDDDGDGLADCDDPDCALSGDCGTEDALRADFDAGVVGFAYGDDTFYGTRQPEYASGDYTPDGGFAGSGGLHLSLGGVDRVNIAGMSGGWSAGFFIDRTSEVQIRLRFRLATSGYDKDECGEALVAVDGSVVRELVRFCGRGHDTGWREISFPVRMDAGGHTLTLGGYGNKKTGALEKTDLYYDDIALIPAE